MRPKIIDRVLVGTALMTALGSLFWFGWKGTTHRRPVRAAEHAQPSATAPADVTVDNASDVTKPWDAPSAQSRGPEWRYDLFTPPEVRYDASTRQLAVKSPDYPAGRDEPAAGLELVGVAANPFRLQLLGYVGGEGGIRGTFENRRTGEVFLAGSGQKVSELNLEIVDFAVRRAAMRLGDGVISSPWIATATVRDRRDGTVTTLIAGETADTPDLNAILAAEDEDGKFTGRFARGDEIEAANRTFRIERLQLSPPEVELVETASQAERVLRLQPVATAPAASDDSAQPPP